ncbi:MAG: hypothetical protein E7368_02380 [Clostridiales bacterium]|nr:hypothetical protein [Clostridiales bacterium]
MNTTTLPATEGTNTTPETIAPKKKKNIAYRIIAAFLVALAVGALFVPFTYVITYNSIKSTSLYEAVIALFTGDASQVIYKLFGFLPTFVPVEPIQGLYTVITFYLLLLCVVFTVIFGIVTVFCSKKAPAMLLTTTFFFTIGFAFYALNTTIFSFFHASTIALDFVCIGLAGFGAILYFVLACIKLKKTAIMNAVQFILSLAFSLAVIYMLGKDKLTFDLGLADLGVSLDWIRIIEKILVGVCALNVMIAGIRGATKKGAVADLFRYFIMMLIGGSFIYLQLNASVRNDVLFIVAIATASVALIQFALSCVQIGIARAIKKKLTTKIIPVEEYVEPAQETDSAKEETFVQEEFAEAVAYDGGPVEGVEVAEVVEEEEVSVPAPAPAPAPAPMPAVETADYDYYNSKSFDPFIATLSTEERNQFTELFILKYKGTMPEIPDYEVGGNNKDFFRKVFIYLGQYRDRIPDGLLSKMYQFAVKL